MAQIVRSPLMLLIGVLALFAQLPPAASGQLLPGGDTAAGFRYPVFSPPNRTLMRKLDTAEKLLEQQRYSEAVRMLNEVVNSQDDADSNEDFFFSADASADDAEGHNYRSLRSEARRLIGQLPKAARESYELQYGIEAQTMLEKAVAAGDVEQLSEVQRRFFHTRAGYEAMVLLGRYHMDHGRPIMAALCFQDVLRSNAAARYQPALSLMLAASWSRAGETERAAQVLVALKRKYPREVFDIGGRKVNLFAQDDQALAWLTNAIGQQRDLTALKSIDWVMFRGNASRTAVGSDSRPLLLRPRWRQRIAMDVDIEKAIAAERQQYEDRSVVALPALQPLALHDMVLMRTPDRLAAVDFDNGKLVWQIEAKTAEAGFNEGTIGSQQSGGKVPNSTAVQRVWVDKTFGSMSSDGKFVFVLEDFGMRPGGSERIIINRQGQRRLYSGTPYNVLAARSVAQAEGKLVWSIGGPHAADPDMATAFFLGPPLPMQGRLYVLAEIKGEVRLLVLNSRTGKQLWSQQLAVVQQSSQFTSKRRTSGISPSYADGVLICPTGVGAVVAVDLTTRNLLWGYQYPEADGGQIVRRGWGIQSIVQPPKVEEIWADTCAVISRGRVVLTPSESPHMHCLSLADGEVQWRIDRDQYAYLACIHDNRAIVIGSDQITSIDMVTGKVAKGWPMKLPEGSLPSGRGYHAGSQYYLPLNAPSGGEVVTVDLNAGKLVGRSKSRNGTVPGNLICYRGHVLSQNSDWLQSFHQFEPLKQQVAKTLRERPDDPLAQLRQAEILVDEGRSSEAVALFRSARDLFAKRAEQLTAAEDHAQRSSARASMIYARQLLFEGLLDGLKSDFAAHADSIAEIQQLIETPRERVNYLRVLALGQEQSERRGAALDAYLQLADASATDNPLLSIDNMHAVRLSHWVRSRLDALRQELGSEDRARLDREVAARRTRAIEAGSLDELRAFDRFFGAHRSADDVKQQLVEKMAAGGHHLQRVLLLGQLFRNSDPVHQRAAAAQLAQLYRQLELQRESALYYHLLRTKWGDEICWQGKTGRELCELLPADSPLRQVPQENRWPHGAVTIQQGDHPGQHQPISYQPAFRLKLLGRRNPMLDEMAVLVDQRQRFSVSGHDGLGRSQWSVSLLDGNQNRNALMVNPGLSCGRTDGPLLVLSVGHQVMAIDTLGAKTAAVRGSPVLWRENLIPSAGGAQTRSRQTVRRTLRQPWTDEAPNQYQQMQIPSRIGPITPGGVTFIRNRDLVSVDPFSGETLWSRKGVVRDADLFGDEDFVFVLSPNQKEAQVLSAIDGRLLGRRKLPAPEERWTMIGRHVLTWRRQAGNNAQWELALYDPWTEKDEWVHPLKAGAKGRLVGNDAVAVLEKSGRFVVLNLADGGLLVDQQLEEDPLLKGIYVITSPDTYLVVTNRGATYNDGNKTIQAMPQRHGSAFVSGRVYAFDRETGESLWQIPATVKQQGLVVNQPADLPVLVFARRVTDRARNRYHLSFLFIDKRTGRLVVPPKEFANREYNFELAGDYNNKTVHVFFQNRSSTITLKFSDDPVPPGPPTQVAGEQTVRGKRFSSTLTAALKALGKAAAASSGLPARDKDDDLFGEDK